MLRTFTICIAFSACAIASADPVTFISPNFASNGSFRSSWLASMGIVAPDVSGLFDEMADGNISGTANIYPGLTMTASNNLATVTGNSSLLGNSNPIGLKAVALRENQSVTLTFATPIDYFSYISIDAGQVDVTVNYTDSTTSSHFNGSGATSGNTGVFFGLDRNDRPQINSVVLFGTGGDNEWGLDNVEYGVVPEPGTVVALSLGALVLIRRRRRV